MAKRYITQLLSQKLGSYLDGLDSTDLKFSVTEAQLQMENVRIKDDALTKLKLPIQIKHGQIRKLDVGSSLRSYYNLAARTLAQNYVLPRRNNAGGHRPFVDTFVKRLMGSARHLQTGVLGRHD